MNTITTPAQTVPDEITTSGRKVATYGGDDRIFSISDQHMTLKGLIKEIGEFNAVVLSWKSEVEAFIADKSGFLNADPMEPENLGTLAVWDTGPDLRAREIELLREEVRLRVKWGELNEARLKALRKLADKTHADHEKAQADVRSKLGSIGYNVDVRPNDYGGITPEMIYRHPTVRSLRDFKQELQNWIGDNAQIQNNESAKQRTLEVLRDKARKAANG